MPEVTVASNLEGKIVSFACYQGKVCLDQLSNKMHLGTFKFGSFGAMGWDHRDSFHVLELWRWVPSDSSSGQLVWWEQGCVGHSQSSLCWFFIFFGKCDFKVWFIESMCALFDKRSRKGYSLAFRLVFLYSVWFSAVLSCRWKLEEKESSYVKLIWILCTCGADFSLLPWACHSKSPHTRAKPFLDSERTWHRKSSIQFWKLVCYFFPLFCFCFPSVSDGYGMQLSHPCDSIV